MIKNIFLLFTVFYFAAGYSNAQHKLYVTIKNRLDREFPHAPVVIKRGELNIGENETVAAVKSEKGGSVWSIPFQLDDIDNDGTWDEMFFELSIKADQVIKAEVEIGPDSKPAPVFSNRVDAVIDSHPRDPWVVHKPLWESELMAYCTYGATQIDMIGKTVPRLSLDYFYGKVKHSQHVFSIDYGQDFFLTANTMSLHSVFIKEADGKIERPWTTNSYSIFKKLKRDAHYSFKIIADGPLRAIIENTVTNWLTDKGTYSFKITYSVAADKRYTTVDLKMLKYPGSADDFQIGAGTRQIYEDIYHQKTNLYLAAVAKDVYEAGILNHFIARGIITGDRYKTEEVYIKNDKTLKNIPNNGPNYGILFPKGVTELHYAFAGSWEKDGGVSSVVKWEKYLRQVAGEIDNPVEIIFFNSK